MSTSRTLNRIICGLLLAGSVATAGVVLPTGTAHAVTGPYQWCPGQPMKHPWYPAGRDLTWDTGSCHTWYYVYYRQGNVLERNGAPSDVWDGDNPPAPPPITCGPLPCAWIP